MFSLVLGAVLLILLWLSFRKQSTLPPGPPKLPLVGSLLFINPFDPLSSFRALAKKYGKLMTIYFGNTPVVVLNDPKIIKDSFEGPVFAGKYLEARAHLPYKISDELLRYLDEIHGIKEIENYVKNMPTSLLEESIATCVSRFIKRIVSNASAPIKLKDEMDWLFYGVAWKILSEYEPPEGNALSKRFLKNSIERANDSWISFCTDFFPRSKLLKLVERVVGVDKNIVVQELLLLHLKTIVELRTFTLQQKQHTLNKDSFAGKLFNEKYLMGSTEDENDKAITDAVNIIVAQGMHFFSGSGPLSSSIRFAIQNLALHPEWQKQIQLEVDSVVKQGETLTWNYMSKMPVLMGFIKETIRHSSVIPLGVPHCLTEEVNIHNYCLPKGTVVLANIDWIHHNECIWDSPNKFNPERFLGDAKFSEAVEEGFLPFSFGARACLGQSIALGELFLTLSVLVKHFHFSLDGEQPKIRYKMGVIVQPQPLKVTLDLRQHSEHSTATTLHLEM